MELRCAVDERGAGERSAVRIECSGDAFAGYRVHLSGQVHVKRLGELPRGLVGELGTREQGPELRVYLGNAGRGAIRFGRNVAKQLLKTRNYLLNGVSAKQPEQLYLMVSMELRHPHERRGAALEHADKLLQSRPECPEIRTRKRREPVELRPREEVHALHGMVVGERR